MTIGQLLIVLNWVAQFGLPMLVAVVLRAEASSTAKALTNLGGSVLITALLSVIAAVTAGHAVPWFDILFAGVTGFAVSAGSYMHIWKPTGVAARAASVGVGSGDRALG